MKKSVTKLKKSLVPLAVSLLFFSAGVRDAFAMAAQPNPDPNAPPPPGWVQWFPLVAMVGIFYFLLIRPQMKQRRERDAMIGSIKKGDKIVTNGGFIVTVTNVGPSILEVKLNDETRAKVQRSAVADILPDSADVEIVPALK